MRYGSPGATLPPHADDEPLFAQNGQRTVIVVFSLGAARGISFSDRDGQEVSSSTLTDGDVLVMGRATQLRYRHSIRAGAAPRLSLSFRWVRHHAPKCLLWHVNGPMATSLRRRITA